MKTTYMTLMVGMWLVVGATGCLAGDVDTPAPATPLDEVSAALDLRSGEGGSEEDCWYCEDAEDACITQCVVSHPAGSVPRAICESSCEDAFEGCWGAAGCDEPDDGACAVVTSVLDIDVPRVQISGTFTVNNAAPVPYDSQSAHIELRNERLGVVDLGSIHTGAYTRWVIPGVYAVVYRHTQGDLLPANAETVLFEAVDLSATGTFDIAIPSVLVMGAITVNGAPAPAGLYERGEVRFRDRATGGTFPVGSSHEGGYFAMVIPGVYDVVWSRSLGGTLVPVNTDAVLLEEVTVAGLTELDVDIPAVLRTGDIRIDGAIAPASIYENGQLYLRDTHTGDVFALGQTRDQAYSRLIVPGTYDVVYSHLLGTTQVPRNEFVVVAEEVAMTTAGDLDIDIPMVTLQGQLSLDGADFPVGFYNRARFWLQGGEASDVFTLGTTGTRTYTVRVVPGTYDLVYQVLSSTGLVPENEWSVVSRGHRIRQPGALLRGSNTLDVAITSGLLAAEVTVWGAAPLVGIYNSGTLLAQGATDDAVTLGTTNDAGGSARVLAGPYALHYSHVLGDFVPANGNARVGEGTTSLVLTPVQVDLQPGQLGGGFSQGGVAFPANPNQSALLGLRDLETGDLIELGVSGGGTYSRLLLGGTYAIVYDQVSGQAVVGNRGATLSCVTFAPQPPR